MLRFRGVLLNVILSENREEEDLTRIGLFVNL